MIEAILAALSLAFIPVDVANHLARTSQGIVRVHAEMHKDWLDALRAYVQ